MDKLIVKDVPPYDGVYEFEDIEFTFAELHRVKQLTGLTRGQFLEAVLARDSDLDFAMALILLERHGLEVDTSVLWAAKPSNLVFEYEKRADDAAPLANDAQPSGGDSSSPVSENQETGQSPTGGQPSDTSATSDPATSAA